MNRRLHHAAKIELSNAFEFYASIDSEIGKDFDLRITAAVREICDFPLSYRLRDGGYRRININRFPFYLPYISRDESLIILAIAHNARHPDYWKKRIS
jgi:plasmid stabilization system protein ParE